MNTKLLAGLAIAAILMGVGSQSFTHTAFADSNQNRSHVQAIGKAAEQEQIRILAEMQANNRPHATEDPGLIHK
ncbi:MAG TPA: hypothetical protein VK431_04560 [Nitrosopumilaceae archaeon]|nr:hypothetical protein [Nitrosopumilaceae archaeon]